MPILRLLLFAACVAASARPALSRDFHVVPESPKQGQLLQVSGGPTATQIRLKGKTVRLFDSLALMPVPVKIRPGTYTLEWLDASGHVLHSASLPVLDAHYPVQNVQLPPTIAGLKSTPDERDEVSEFFKAESLQRFWTLPIHPPLQSCITSPFGVARAINGKLTGDIHGGLDQRGAAGTPIHAAAAGDVRLAGQFALHGGTVGLDHGQGLKSMYLHMSKIAVHPGDHLAAGDVIGFVGSTGRSTAPHLHWALYAQGEPVNPLQWLDLQPCSKPAPVRARRKPARAS